MPGVRQIRSLVCPEFSRCKRRCKLATISVVHSPAMPQLDATASGGYGLAQFQQHVDGLLPIVNGRQLRGLARVVVLLIRCRAIDQPVVKSGYFANDDKINPTWVREAVSPARTLSPQRQPRERASRGMSG